MTGDSRVNTLPNYKLTFLLSRMFRRFLKVANRSLVCCPRGAIGAIALAAVAIIGALDYLTGPEISLSVFHLAPVVFAVWFGKRHDGLIIAIVASLVWSLDDLIAGYAYGHPGILVWDIVAHGIFLSFGATLLRILREHLANEQRLARHDSLTGLLNWRAFQERLEYSLALSARDRQPLTLAYLDLDDFKKINDTYGHTQGDGVLVAIAMILTETIRATDTVARVGGDEFALLFPGTDKLGAQDVLGKLSQCLSQRLNTKGHRVTCSVGAVTFPHPPHDGDEAISIADHLMYQVKHRGKGAIAYGVFDHATGKVVELA